jgi:hypothetical protein
MLATSLVYNQEKIIPHSKYSCHFSFFRGRFWFLQLLLIFVGENPIGIGEKGRGGVALVAHRRHLGF